MPKPHIELDNDVKKRIERLSIIEGCSQKEIVSRSVILYELMILARRMKGQKPSPELLSKMAETSVLLRSLGKAQFKELTKVKTK